MLTTYPCIGALIAISKAKGCGTLGGYVLVEGEVMGLTCHHVAFGDNRYEAYPTTVKYYAALYPAILRH
jgi:hypothetical protein